MLLLISVRELTKKQEGRVRLEREIERESDDKSERSSVEKE